MLRSVRDLRRIVAHARLSVVDEGERGSLPPYGSGARDTATQGASCFASTSNGAVQGADLGRSCVFLGIPFAAPPVGSLRWKPPQPAANWAPATLNATVTPPVYPQVNPPASTGTAGNENCLRVNIWSPNPTPTRPAPVIVWIHTGAFMAASANLA